MEAHFFQLEDSGRSPTEDVNEEKRHRFFCAGTFGVEESVVAGGSIMMDGSYGIMANVLSGGLSF